MSLFKVNWIEGYSSLHPSTHYLPLPDYCEEGSPVDIILTRSMDNDTEISSILVPVRSIKTEDVWRGQILFVRPYEASRFREGAIQCTRIGYETAYKVTEITGTIHNVPGFPYEAKELELVNTLQLAGLRPLPKSYAEHVFTELQAMGSDTNTFSSPLKTEDNVRSIEVSAKDFEVRSGQRIRGSAIQGSLRTIAIESGSARN